MKRAPAFACLPVYLVYLVFLSCACVRGDEGLGVISNGIPSSVTAGSSPPVHDYEYGRFRYHSMYGPGLHEHSSVLHQWFRLEPSENSGSFERSAGDLAEGSGGWPAKRYYYVARIQRALRKDGSYGGPIDGLIGPQTCAAIRACQTKLGFPITGRIDGRLLRSLGIR